MKRGEERVETRTVTPGKKGTRIAKDRYEGMKRAILTAVPRSRGGVAFLDLPRLVRPHLPREAFAGASVTWYLTVVKLDLEARGLLERVPDAKPQRLRRP